jgi:hypothetical protein
VSVGGVLDRHFLDTILIKIVSVEDVFKRRRKTRDCTIEAHPEVQYTIIGIK